MTKAKETAVASVQRTSAGLRDAIFDELDAIRNGTSNPTRANAVAKLASGIVETVRMEVEVQRHLRHMNTRPATEAAKADAGLFGASLALGSNA